MTAAGKGVIELLFCSCLPTSSPLCKCHMALAFSCQERNVLLETHTALLHEQRFNFKPLIRVICTEAAGNVFKLDKILFHVSELGWGCAASAIRSVTFP